MEPFTAFLLLLLFPIFGAAIYWKKLATHLRKETHHFPEQMVGAWGNALTILNSPVLSSQPFPEHIVRARRDAGAKVGWMGRYSYLTIYLLQHRQRCESD